jgi:hypothetical protein
MISFIYIFDIFDTFFQVAKWSFRTINAMHYIHASGDNGRDPFLFQVLLVTAVTLFIFKYAVEILVIFRVKAYGVEECIV